MANLIMVLGESGTGKSTSIETLDPQTTFIIQVVNKPLPFRGYKTKYPLIKKGGEGNRIITDNADNIIKALRGVEKLENIKTIIIDDSQYIMANEFIRKATEKGFDKFTQIGQNFYNIIDTANDLREDLNVIFLHHIESTDTGKVKAKTIGKLLDDKIGLEGRFTIVLMTEIEDGKYYFRTQNSGFDTCKSPKGMFEDIRIPNDLNLVIEASNKYFN